MPPPHRIVEEETILHILNRHAECRVNHDYMDNFHARKIARAHNLKALLVRDLLTEDIYYKFEPND